MCFLSSYLFHITSLASFIQLLPARDQALCGQTHRTQGADSLEGEGFWPLLWYVVCQSFDNGITTLHSIGHTVGIQ